MKSLIMKTVSNLQKSISSTLNKRKYERYV